MPRGAGYRRKLRMNFGPTPKSEYDQSMKSFTTVIERDAQTGLFIGYVPGWPGAHSQGATLEELRANLGEVVAMLLEDGEPRLETQFVGTEQLKVA
jgi:predicted RNase H-like HicB family nuclease